MKTDLAKLSKLLLAFAFLVNSLLVPISIQGLVLCVDEDHIALEIQIISSERSCDTAPVSHQLKTESGYHSDDCADVPLYQHVQDVLHAKQNRVIHPARIILTPPAFLPLAVWQSTHHNPASFLPYPRQSTLQSVVLLI